MDDNVMKKYTLRSDEARHYVQYDQGMELYSLNWGEIWESPAVVRHAWLM